MARTVKDPEVRKREIVDAAIKLFADDGYDETAVSDIVKEAGVAQGTFYYYFKSKEDILDEIAKRVVDQLNLSLGGIMDNPDLEAMDKMMAITKFFQDIGKDWGKLMEFIHEDRNAHLHMKMEKAVYPVIIPPYTKIIEQGCSEGIFHVKYPEETAISMLAASNALTGGQHSHDGKLNLDPQRIIAIFDIEERLLGAKEGTFGEYLKRKGVTF